MSPQASYPHSLFIFLQILFHLALVAPLLSHCSSLVDPGFELPDFCIVLCPHLAHHLFHVQPHVFDGLLETFSPLPLLPELVKLEQLLQLLKLIVKHFFSLSSFNFWLVLVPIIPVKLLALFNGY